MTVAPGTQVDRYEVIDLIGKGAMGEVYRARDSRLSRDVAIKVLPAEFTSDAERLRRFDQEARAAGALNHPNIVAVYDVGTHGGAPFVVSELLEGETLRERIQKGTLPMRKVLQFGAETARGLAAAHAKGIVHRDLKPENLFVTREGHVKILDFGLAKLKRRDEAHGHGQPDSLVATATGTGMILGTAGYMAPEQVKGEGTDFRADIFALGCVLYEMASGERAFHGSTPVETMFSILHTDIAEFPEAVRRKAPAFVSVVRRCVEKEPSDRFESARDLAFALQVMGESGPSQVEQRPAEAQAPSAPDVSYRRITFRRGLIWNARFTPDGHSVVYGGAWEGKAMEVYWVHLSTPESRPLGLGVANLLSVSVTGEMAVLLNLRFSHPFLASGTLARVPPMGGGARELLHDVQEAEWNPQGSDLAVVREKDGMVRLEYPIGSPLYQTAGWIDRVRFTSDGQYIVFIDHPAKTSDDGSVVRIDLRGTKRVLSEGWGTIRGLACTPDGKEVWFTADKAGAARGLYAVSPEGGDTRKVLQLASNLTVHDIHRDGRVLVSHGPERAGISCLPPGQERERDLSWLDWSLTTDISKDGRTLLFTESAEGGGDTGAVYLRPTDGTTAIRLTDGGTAHGVSPDGSWVLTGRSMGRPYNDLFVTPTGAGEQRHVDCEGLRVHFAAWLANGTHAVIAGNEEGSGVRLFVLDLQTGERRPISPEGISPASLMCSPDGKTAAASIGGQYMLYPVESGDEAPTVMKGVEDGESLAGWSADAEHFYVFRSDELPVRVFRVHKETGEREKWRELSPPDPTGIYRISRLRVAPSDDAYAYSYFLQLLDLHVIEGLR